VRALHSGPASGLIHVVPSTLRQLEALTQGRQQLVGGSEPELAPRVDFLNPSGDATFGWVGVGVELEDERGLHHMNDVTAPAAGRCESRVQLCVKFALNPFRGCARQEYGSTSPGPQQQSAAGPGCPPTDQSS
jgi:hypothetical protein